VRLNHLGGSELEVSELCLGTMQFGWTADEAGSFATLDAYVSAGGNFIDTADIYSNWVPGHRGGEAEEILGRWMQSRRNRDGIVVATKLRGRMWDGPDGEGLGRGHIMRAVEDSLRRLQVETIDLYQCHWPDEATSIEETLRAFEDLVRSGKVRYAGASNYTARQLEEAASTAKRAGVAGFVALQPHYNLVHRTEFEGSMARECGREGLGVIPYSPLAGGFLTGKYSRDGPAPKSQRARQAQRYMTEQGYAVIDAIGAIAADRSTTVAAVALAWLLANPLVTAPIIGANAPEQLADLLPACDLTLTGDDLRALDAVSAGM
jgi:aryl-alcohol dehydrogenase-like predicted oxidoreductase